jgi:hypothetical protein
MLSPSHIASLPATFLAAEYKWEWHGVWESLRIGEPAPGLEQAFAEARRFGIVSAANPGQIMRSDPENRSADRALQRRLDDLGLIYRAAFVAAHSRSWKAFNWLVVDPEPAVFDALAAEFGQIGTLLWARGEPVRLRMNAYRPVAVPPHPWIDWIDEAGGILPAPTGALLDPAP